MMSHMTATKCCSQVLTNEPKVCSLMRGIFCLLQRFLVQTGGHQGGWDDYDHQIFLKMRSKIKVQCHETCHNNN